MTNVNSLGNQYVKALYSKELIGGFIGSGSKQNLRLIVKDDPSVSSNQNFIDFKYDTTNPTMEFSDETTIKNVKAPINDSDVSNKKYVDDKLNLSKIKDACKVSVIGNLDVVSFANDILKVDNMNVITSSLLNIDGIVIEVGNRVLVREQTNQTQNGVYTINSINGSEVDLLRTNDILDYGIIVSIKQGSVNAKKIYVLNDTNESNKEPVINTHTLIFNELVDSNGVSITTSDGLSIDSNNISLNLESNTLLSINSDKLHLKSSTSGGEILVSSGIETSDPVYTNSIGKNNETLKINTGSSGLQLSKDYSSSGDTSQPIYFGSQNVNGNMRQLIKNVNGSNHFLIQEYNEGNWNSLCVFTK